MEPNDVQQPVNNEPRNSKLLQVKAQIEKNKMSMDKKDKIKMEQNKVE